jgi:hypothetical protein
MGTLNGYTPSGQRLAVHREDQVWVVICDKRQPVRDDALDLALGEALRHDSDETPRMSRLEPAKRPEDKGQVVFKDQGSRAGLYLTAFFSHSRSGLSGTPK